MYVYVINYMIIMKFHSNKQTHLCLPYCSGRVFESKEI
jgi:hypothetical protein